MRRKILPFSDSDIDYRHTIPNFLSMCKVMMDKVSE